MDCASAASAHEHTFWILLAESIGPEMRLLAYDSKPGRELRYSFISASTIKPALADTCWEHMPRSRYQHQDVEDVPFAPATQGLKPDISQALQERDWQCLQALPDPADCLQPANGNEDVDKGPSQISCSSAEAQPPYNLKAKDRDRNQVSVH